jgi:hypothetical protein
VAPRPATWADRRAPPMLELQSLNSWLHASIFEL